MLTKTSEHIRLVRLLGKHDGDETHSVAIVNEWVFDSSLQEALPLCKKSLNFICGKNNECIGISKGYEFVHFSNEKSYLEKK